MTRNEKDAEDLVQEALLRAYRFFDTFEAGHQLQGLAVPHPHQRLLQPVPRARARARRPDRGGVVARRTSSSSSAARQRRARHRDGAARPDGLRRRREGAGGRAVRLPDGGHPRRPRGLLVQGDRRDHGLPGGHGDEPALPRPEDPAGPPVRLRRRAGDHPPRAPAAATVGRRRRGAGRPGGLPAPAGPGQGSGGRRELRRGRRRSSRPTSTASSTGVDREAVERHLVGCPSCARQVHLEARFKAAVRAHLPRPEVPLALAAAHQGGAGDAADRAAPLAGLAVLPAPGPGGGGGPADRRDHRDRAPVAVDGARAGASAATTPRCRWTSPARTAGSIASWFRGRVDFPVHAPALGGGATCQGGRLVNVGERPAAYIVYRVRNGHRVTFLVFDPRDQAFEAPERRVVNGREIYLRHRSRHLDRGLPRPRPRLRRHVRPRRGRARPPGH